MPQYLISKITIFSLFILMFSDNQHPSYQVEHYGALRTIMHEGDISSQAELSDMRDKENLYALGAYEDLKGEIQIFGGEPWNTRVKNEQIKIDKSFDGKAALLVTANVKNWHEISVPNSVNSFNSFEEFLLNTAEELGINVNEPFPFLLDGVVETLNWHVIDWPDGDTIHTHQKHKESGLNGVISKEEVLILGFYSDSHHGIFTHHTTNIHMHFKSIHNHLAGHLDDFTPGSGMILKVPYL